jgi:hypothetical protein
VGIIEVPYRTPQVLQIFLAEGESIIEKCLRRVAAIEIQAFNQFSGAHFSSGLLIVQS